MYACVVLLMIGTPAAAPTLAEPERVRLPEMIVKLDCSLAVTTRLPPAATVAASPGFESPSISASVVGDRM